MILSVKRKNIITIILITVILSAIITFIAYPTVREIKSLSQQIYDYRLYLEKLYIQGQLLKNITEELKEVEPDLEKLSKVLIGKNQELNCTQQLQYIEKEFDEYWGSQSQKDFNILTLVVLVKKA